MSTIQRGYVTMWWFVFKGVAKIGCQTEIKVNVHYGNPDILPTNLCFAKLPYDYLPVIRSQVAAVQPQMALNITTNMGVSIPNSRPIIPLFAFIGKTTKS